MSADADSAIDPKQMSARFVGRMLLIAHGSSMPHDDAWQRAIDMFHGHDLTQLRVLVVTRGGGPSPSQQARLSKALGGRGRKLPVAVMSDSGAIRFMASAIALFMPRLRTFRVAELPEACSYLALDEQERKAAFDFLSLEYGPES